MTRISRKKTALLIAFFIASVLVGQEVSFRDFSFENTSSVASEGVNGTLVGDWQQVKRVVDGDTIELENGEKVRYIGVNAPESVKPHSPVECFGHEANAYNKNLLDGRRVRLEKDISDRDRYGRLLRFVYLEDGTFVNDRLVREGYAYADTFPPDVAKADEFKQTQAEARTAHRGLWSPDTCDGKK